MRYIPYNIMQLLYKKVLDQPSNEEEQQELVSWESGKDQLLPFDKKDIDIEKVRVHLRRMFHAESQKQELWEKLHAQIVESRKPLEIPAAKSGRIWPAIVAAASIVIILSVVTYLISTWLVPHQETNLIPIVPEKIANNILTLEDGSQVQLKDFHPFNLHDAKYANIEIIRDSQIIYRRNGSPESNTNMVYHTLSTPNGDNCEVRLSDGTLVRLNATSSLRFPTRFIGKERRVYISGEAYFEVAENKENPFYVEAGKRSARIDIKVLGTHFNVRSYPDEAVIKTSLVKGSVEITSNNRKAILKPGQEAIWFSNDSMKIEPKMDEEKLLAWKNGWFVFRGDSIETVMNELARWYGIKTQYKEKIVVQALKGSVLRSSPIDTVLKIFETTNGVSFIRRGNNITVMKYQRNEH